MVFAPIPAAVKIAVVSDVVAMSATETTDAGPFGGIPTLETLFEPVDAAALPTYQRAAV